MKPSEVLRKQDNFLSNPDDLYYEIHCVQCRKPLWTTRILKRRGTQVVSSETHALGHSVGFNARIRYCPRCSRPFYGVGQKGDQMYLIKDRHSGLTRLI